MLSNPLHSAKLVGDDRMRPVRRLMTSHPEAQVRQFCFPGSEFRALQTVSAPVPPRPTTAAQTGPAAISVPAVVDQNTLIDSGKSALAV